MLLLWPTRQRVAAFGLAGLIAGMLVVPGGWSALTTLHTSANETTPEAYAEIVAAASGRSARPGSGGPGGGRDGGSSSGADATLIEYLQSHTQATRYLLAVASALSGGSSYVLQTGRPVLYIGGFYGSDAVIDADGLRALVAAGDLRYILWGERGGRGGNSSIGTWLQANCTPVTDVSSPSGTLYECGS